MRGVTTPGRASDTSDQSRQDLNVAKRKTTGFWYARQQASASGLPKYSTGRPCINGHLSHRATKTGHCLRCNADRRAAARAINPEESRLSARAWYKAHPERFSAWAKEYRQQNPDRIRALNETRRAREKGAAIGKVTASDFADILKRQKYKCAWCRKSIKEGAQQDHVIPLSKGGSHSVRNIVGACATCNRSKKDALPEVFARRLGFLI